MSLIPPLGGLVATALSLTTLFGLAPVAFTGTAAIAVWLVSILIGIVTYVVLAQAMADAHY